MSLHPKSPELSQVVADIFTVPLTGKPLKHPDMRYEFQLSRRRHVMQEMRRRKLWGSKQQGSFLFSLLAQLPPDNMAWVKKSVSIPPSINCYERAADDIFRAAAALPSQAMHYLSDYLTQAWEQPNPTPPFNDEILLSCYTTASSAKDIRQAYKLGLLCTKFLTADGLVVALNDANMRTSFVGLRTWCTLLEVALEDRPDELLYNDMLLGDFLQQSPVTQHRIQKIAQIPVVQSCAPLPPEWIDAHHTTS